jgi:hypothetical protein
VSRPLQEPPAGTRIERYLAHLDALTAGTAEPRFLQLDSSLPATKGVVALTYTDLPEVGFLTALTYGLSLVGHSEWRAGKPELCINVRSHDDRWAWAAASVADQLRGRSSFAYGETINLGEPVSPESRLSSFVLFAPAVLDREDYLGIDVGDQLPINITGLYPIHGSERLWIHEHGLEAFFKLSWDPFDVHRPIKAQARQEGAVRRPKAPLAPPGGSEREAGSLRPVVRRATLSASGA